MSVYTYIHTYKEKNEMYIIIFWHRWVYDMMEYTVDFGAQYIEATNDEEAGELSLKYVDENHGLWKNEIAEVHKLEDGSYMIDLSPIYVKAKNSDIAMKKAEKYANDHNLEIVDVDDGFKIE